MLARYVAERKQTVLSEWMLVLSLNQQRSSGYNAQHAVTGTTWNAWGLKLLILMQMRTLTVTHVRVKTMTNTGRNIVFLGNICFIYITYLLK